MNIEDIERYSGQQLTEDVKNGLAINNIMEIARNAALEEAAQIADQWGGLDGEGIAKDIRQLKDV